ncbi:MAG: hypothetical protein H7222_00785 [Methylotenera sp.]|nr:hypothetical protein [Oligoflexia bacterium]
MALVELALGVWLFSGLKLKKAAIVALILHVAYFFWALFNVQRGLNLQNCGCFGVHLARPLTYGTVVEDFALTLICGLLVRLAPPENPAPESSQTRSPLS